MSKQATITVEPRATLTVVSFAGELDLGSVNDEMVETAMAAADLGHPLLIDLSAVRFLDSTALGLLVAMNERSRHRLHLTSVPRQVLRVLQLAGLAAVLPLAAEEADDVR